MRPTNRLVTVSVFIWLPFISYAKEVVREERFELSRTLRCRWVLSPVRLPFRHSRMVRRGRLELPQGFRHHQPLKLARLPFRHLRTVFGFSATD